MYVCTEHLLSSYYILYYTTLLIHCYDAHAALLQYCLGDAFAAQYSLVDGREVASLSLGGQCDKVSAVSCTAAQCGLSPFCFGQKDITAAARPSPPLTAMR